MSHPEIIIPFALPPAEHAKDLVKLLTSECGLDGLAMLLSRSRTFQREHYDDFAPALPHEIWLSKRHNSLITLCHKFRQTLADGYWFVINPVHLHIASNHLVLTDYRQLELLETESRPLFEIARSVFQEAGMELVYGDAANWLLRADAWSEMTTTTPDAACGHNIEIWSPQGPLARSWRKLQNEIQMEWFIHPVQEQRQRRAAKVINGMWLWAGTQVGADANQPGTELQANSRATELIAMPHLTVLDQLSLCALANDWGSWAALMQQLDQDWFKPLLSALRARQLQQVNLVLSNTNTLLQVQTSTGSLRRFWRSASFKHLSHAPSQ